MEHLALVCLLLTLSNGLLLYAEAIEKTFSNHTPKQDINDRLTKIEALLEASLAKNAELENRIEVLEGESKQLKASVRALEQVRDGEQDKLEAEAEERNAGSSTQASDTIKPLATRRSDKVPRQAVGPIVAFTAEVGPSLMTHLGTGQTILYDRIVTNVGGAYDKIMGVFTVPLTGVYVFNINTMVNPGDDEYLELVKNGIGIQSTYADVSKAEHYTTSSMTITLEASQNDAVWVRTAKWTNGGSGTINGYGFSKFSGWLLAHT